METMKTRKPLSKEGKKKKAAYDKIYREKKKEKIAAQSHARYIENKEEIGAYNKSYYQDNKEVILKKTKAYYYNNHEPQKLIRKEYRGRPENIEKKRLHGVLYREEHKEKRAAQMHEWTHDGRGEAWRGANLDKLSAAQAKRRAVKKSAILPTTDFAQIKKIFTLRDAMIEEFGEKYHVDHIIALENGGAHHQENLRVITAKENLEKGYKYIPELGGVWANNDLAREYKKKHNIECE